MTINRLKIMLIIEAVIGVILLCILRNTMLHYDVIITFPFLQIGRWLRILSEKADSYNVLAWLLYILLSGWPLGIFFIRRSRGHHKNEETLLLLASGLLFMTHYYMINPKLSVGVFSPAAISNASLLSLASVTYMTFFSYFLFRLVRRYQMGDAKLLLSDLGRLLVLLSMILVWYVSFIAPMQAFGAMRVISSTNVITGVNFSNTDSFILLRQLAMMIPVFYQLLIVFAGCELVEALKNERYGQAVVEKAELLGKRCRESIVVMVLVTLSVHLLQLLWGASLYQIDYHIDFSLESIIAVVFTLLLAKYLEETSQIKHENDLFI